ncbi:MAG: CsgG/HfaB family protein [Chromatiales bacterium]|nr:CsgG/HfaB family protein [Chromatiales bacterium]
MALRHTLFPLLLPALLLVGCSSATVISGGDGPTIREAQAEPYNGNKPRIAVQPFTGKGGAGKGVADMLTDSLFNTNRFIVLEREQIDAVIAEQELAESSHFRKESVAPQGQLEGAELLIKGTITQFEPECRGGSLLLIGAKQACIAITLRIIDVATGRIVNSTTVEGTSGTSGIGLVFTKSTLPIGLGAWSKTPMEEALRQCIEKAVNHITTTKF